MRKALKEVRNKTIRKLFNADFEQITQSINKISADLDDSRKKMESIERTFRLFLDSFEKSLEATKQNNLILKDQRDNTQYQQQILREVRKSEEYKSVFKNQKPLITVRIASYNKTDELINRAIASVLRQTYQNFEIIIVNDGPNEKTKRAIEKLGDKRIKYIELPQRTTYPDDAHRRWLVAGSPGMNEATRRAKGDWIAPLDDDDEFADNHLEKLLEAAIKHKVELVYGALERVNTNDSSTEKIFSNPPKRGGFSFQGALYLSLIRFFEYDERSWIVDEPGDWNLCRRMLAAGVTYYGIDDVVAKIYHTPLNSRVTQ